MPPEKPDIPHFTSIPWCKALITNPAYAITANRSRHVKPNGEDLLFGKTINSPSTMSKCIALYKKPSSETAEIQELCTLVTLGSDLDGYPQVLHGGIQATILDEFTGNLVGIIKEREYEQAKARDEHLEKAPWVTGEMTVKYLRPVTTPATVCVRTWLVKGEGRKYWVDGAIEDGDGTVLATAQCLLIQLRPQKI
jgi:acyl-coenzyme A thioesterase PaaI-like protein